VSLEEKIKALHEKIDREQQREAEREKQHHERQLNRQITWQAGGAKDEDRDRS
jgi:hypothetical protein